ncbi:DUF6906 family protein [Bacillus cereus]|uniref:DUF6906 family protein n=1 Tax=Bacillus cereus TaxID=1396 RepID=UPI003F6DAF0C
MKQGKSPTKRRKMPIKSYNLNADNWLIYKKISEGLHVVHRYANATRVIVNL